MMTARTTLRPTLILSLFAVVAILAGAGPLAASDPGADKLQFAYRLGTVSGATLETGAAGWHGIGEGRFRVQLLPAGAEAWDMREVSLLGVEFRNLGPTELVLDLRLNNANATDWANTAQGRTIVQPGETLPLVIGLGRPTQGGTSHPAFLRMSGWPDGTFRHWQGIKPETVVSLDIRSATEGGHRFELGRMVAVRALEPHLLQRMPFIDRYGQYMHRDWPEKVRSDEDFQRHAAEEAAWSAGLGEIPGRSRFGGWKDGPRLEATGRFRVEQVDGRWWFVDPEGYLFWSHGVTGVGYGNHGSTPLDRDGRVFEALPATDDPAFGVFYTGNARPSARRPEGGPAHYGFGLANLRRKHGPGWREAALRQEVLRVRYAGLNTLAAWSDHAVAEAARLPYTVILHFTGALAAEVLPDPFDPRSREALRTALRNHPVAFRDDPFCLGVFINNELHWGGQARALVTTILRFRESPTAAKTAIRDWLQAKYGTIAAFNAAWKVTLTEWDALLGGLKGVDLAGMNQGDAREITDFVADRYYRMVSEELKAFAPDVLNLGSRMHTSLPEVIAAAARHVDVLSANVYQFEPAAAAFSRHGRPVIIGEFHFGNLTGTNLGPGLRSAQDATQQVRLYRHYLRRAVADPAIVGAHWFQWRDQSVGGRTDGENYDIGFFDVTDQPKRSLIEAAAAFSREWHLLRR